MSAQSFDNWSRPELISELQALRRQLADAEQKVAIAQEESAACRAGEEKYRFLLDESSDPIVTLAPDGQYLYANKEFARGRGKTCDEVIGKTLWDVFPEEEADRRFAILQSVCDKGETSVIELVVPRSDGEHFYIATVKPIFDQQCQVTSALCISKEFTERKRMEEALMATKLAAEHASLDKTRFLAAASHDLRQPIQAIGLFNDALTRTDLSQVQRELCANVSRSLHALSDLLTKLLEISRLDVCVIKACPDVVELGTLFDDIDAVLSPLALEKSLRFKFFFPLREMALLTDGKLLMSLLGNLIGNAIKYTERGGVLVGVRRRGNHAAIQVWDTGIGIAPENIQKVFEEYFQVGHPRQEGNKGLGLGLAITKRLAMLLETEVVCRSRVGKGSVFEVRVPIAE